MSKRSRPKKPTPIENLGDGWRLLRCHMGTWTKYVIYHDRGDGHHSGLYASHCLKRDALAYMAQHRGPQRAAINGEGSR